MQPSICIILKFVWSQIKSLDEGSDKIAWINEQIQVSQENIQILTSLVSAVENLERAELDRNPYSVTHDAYNLGYKIEFFGFLHDLLVVNITRRQSRELPIICILNNFYRRPKD